MSITPISFMGNNSLMQVMQMRNTRPVDPIKKIEAKATEDPTEKKNKDNNNQQDEKTAFKGAEALANYNRAMFMSNPINTRKVLEPPTPEKIKQVEVHTPSFKAEEGIENLEASIETHK